MKPAQLAALSLTTFSLLSACGPGGEIAAGACGDQLEACTTGCVDLLNDRLNCGACGNVCPSDEVCQGGACGRIDAHPNFQAPAPPPDEGSAGCAAGEIACGTGCVDPRNDSRNCGGCNTVCPEPEACSEGLCALP